MEVNPGNIQERQHIHFCNWSWLQTDITLPTNVHGYGQGLWSRLWSSQWSCTSCESWAIKKAEHQRIFELWRRRRLLRVPWIARRSNQSILKKINHEYSLEALMLKLKLQDFGHLMQRANSLENTLMLEKTEGRRRRR